MVFKKGNTGYWKGKSRSEETKRKLSATGRGRHYSPATEFKKGRIMPEAEKMKHRGHPSWNKKERVEIECRECHKKFLVISTEQFTRLFCSRSCSTRHTFTGRVPSDDHKRKIGEANKGCLKGVRRSPQTEFKTGQIPWNKGKHISDESKRRISEARKGQIPWNKGKSGYVLKEVWQGRPQSKKGKENPKWKYGRKVTKARDHHIRRSYGFIPLNDCDHASWVAHHLDKEYVLYIPEELHISIRHKLTDQHSMDAINKAAIEWYVDYYGLM